MLPPIIRDGSIYGKVFPANKKEVRKTGALPVWIAKVLLPAKPGRSGNKRKIFKREEDTKKSLFDNSSKRGVRGLDSNPLI